jgi:ribosomal protein S18 acetylase RimI-like enzyme
VTIINPPNSCLRSVDTRRDLLAVADLIEISFSNQIDQDGREYLRQIRRAARESSILRWVPGPSERVSFPLHGYVWEEDKRVVGNLTLTPNRWNGNWKYLIANVAVHPDFQQRGIGRQLTEKAIEHIRKHRVKSAWLQVRDDNLVAQHLYRSLGFSEQTRRATWISEAHSNTTQGKSENVHITGRTRMNWIEQRLWLEAAYPQNVAWYLMFNSHRFKPSVWRILAQFIDGKSMNHWAAHSNGELIGVATWEPGKTFADVLWLALNPEHEDQAIRALLPHVQRAMAYKHRPMIINYPGGRCLEAFEDADFKMQNTLIWMMLDLSGDPA